MLQFAIGSVAILLLGTCATTTGPCSPISYGQLLRPEGPGPFPAIILLHGARGVGRAEFIWSQRFIRAGYVVLVMASGLIKGYRLLATARQRARELTGAVMSLQTLQAVQGDAIAVLGRSHEAWVALRALTRFYAQAPDMSQQAIAPFFPSCERGEDDWAGWNVKGSGSVLAGRGRYVKAVSGVFA